MEAATNKFEEEPSNMKEAPLTKNDESNIKMEEWNQQEKWEGVDDFSVETEEWWANEKRIPRPKDRSTAQSTSSEPTYTSWSSRQSTVDIPWIDNNRMTGAIKSVGHCIYRSVSSVWTWANPCKKLKFHESLQVVKLRPSCFCDFFKDRLSLKPLKIIENKELCN